MTILMIKEWRRKNKSQNDKQFLERVPKTRSVIAQIVLTDHPGKGSSLCMLLLGKHKIEGHLLQVQVQGLMKVIVMSFLMVKMYICCGMIVKVLIWNRPRILIIDERFCVL